MRSLTLFGCAACLIALAIGSSACKREKKPEPTNISKPPIIPQNRAKTTKPFMDRMEAQLSEIRRRVRGRVLAPKAVIPFEKSSKAYPTDGRGSPFLAKSQHLIRQVAKLREHPDDLANYNAVVDACIDCHRVYSKTNVKRLDALKLSADEMRPAPPANTPDDPHDSKSTNKKASDDDSPHKEPTKE